MLKSTEQTFYGELATRELLSVDAWYKSLNRSDRIAVLLNELDANESVTGDKATKTRIFKDAEIVSALRMVDKEAKVSDTLLEALQFMTVEELQGYCLQPPSWLFEFRHAFETNETHLADLDKKLKEQGGHFGFLNVFAPLLNCGFRQLKQSLDDLARRAQLAPFVPEQTAENLFRQLLPRVANMISRTMVLELNVARLRGQLSGDTPEERFASFITMISDPVVALKILQEYPVLCRQVTIAVRQWIDNSLELMQRLTADWQLIKQTFDVDDPATLARVEASAGDSHQNGRTVAIFVFDSGFKLVYKPRSMAVDVHFQELLEWVNERGDHPPFKTINVIDRDSYGWSEFVEAKPCSAQGELERFYERQGGHLALLYVLNATDFHAENLIAAGEHPVLIDLESLFHAKAKLRDRDSGVADVAAKVLAESVLRVGLLPQRIWGENPHAGLEISGLGGAPGQTTPFRVPQWEKAGTDEMRFHRDYVQLPGNKNRPTLGEQEVDTLEFTNSIIKGFEVMYDLLQNDQDALLAENGLVERFANDEIRYIARSTRQYATMLVDSFHPDLLRDALDRESFFDRLQNASTQRPELSRLIEFERADLWRNDIPFFTSKPGLCDLLSSSKEVVKGFFETASMDAVKQLVQNMNDENCTRQCELIRCSLTALAMGDSVSRNGYDLLEPGRAADLERLLHIARAIGDRLVNLTLRDKGEATWIGLNLVYERYWQVAPMNPSLYDGVAGVALFLGYLGKVVNEASYTHCAEEATCYVSKQWKQYGNAVKTSSNAMMPIAIGAYGQSPVSAIYLLTHLGKLWDSDELLLEAESLVDLLPHLVAHDENYDIISGAAGCIKVLLNLYSIRPSDQTIEVALKCGDLLLERAVPMTSGVGWKSMSSSGQPLAGFSHGAAGIAWALMQLGHYTGESRFIDCAKEAIAYERSLFDPEAGNWLDLREDSQDNQGKSNKKDVDELRKSKFMTAWCHGAPGIGLSRLDLLTKYGPDPGVEAEVKIAIKTTQINGFGLNHCLCHGDLGNLELLLNASMAFDDPILAKEFRKTLAMILDGIERHGWLTGVPLGTETPGLMTGISGIGYQLLRFAVPDRVPSVLLLESPSRNGYA